MSSIPQAIGNVREVDITSEMQVAYLDYAMSVIVSRALPDVRDGLKPVHRRILYAMADMGLTADRPYKKSARIVGEVLGKYHPHSDTAVYDAMVRMAQDFSLRYPLVDGQGNFGSLDGDNAAAMRYTEARLARISDLMLTDLEKETVDWVDNFDNTLKEPGVLPAALPNLLINGANGIAVGMSTNIPPHNLGEIVDALVFMLDHYDQLEEIGVEDLMRFVKGPDFPTAGIIYRYRKGRRSNDDNTDAIVQGYATGRARLILQAKAHFEEMSRNRSRIVITELPYQINKTNLLERIATLVRDGRIEGITDLRDESDRAGMRIVIELTRNVESKAVLADLFKYTPMQQTFGMSMLALVDGEPKVLSLKRMLHLFIEHRLEVIRRRSEYDLAKARARSHIVEGLLKALDVLDEVIDTIRRSQRVDTARNNLRRKFGFSEAQAQAILDMPLKRLAALERRRLQDEFKALTKQIKSLEDLLSDPQKMRAVIKEELLALRAQYNDKRRTQIVERTKGTLTTTDLLPDQKVWVSVAANGELRRQSFASISKTSLRQMGRGSEVALLTANTRDYLYLFSRNGQCRRVSIHKLPTEKGKHLAEFTDFSRRNTVTAALALPRLAPDETQGYLFLITRSGTVKRIELADFMEAAANDPEVMRVEDDDQLGWVYYTAGEQEMILVSSAGKSIRFSEEDVRSMGLSAGGVAGMKLKKGESIVSAAVVDSTGELLTVSEKGYCKRTPLAEYSSQGRNGSGIIAHKTSARTGPLTDAVIVDPAGQELVVFVTAKGVAKPVNLADVPDSGRNTQGQQVVTLAKGDSVAALKVVESTPDIGPDGDDGAGPDANPNGAAGDGKEAAPASRSKRRRTDSNGAGSSKSQASTKKSTSKSTKKKSTSTAKNKKSSAKKSRSSASPRRRSTKSTAKEAEADGAAAKGGQKKSGTPAGKKSEQSSAQKDELVQGKLVGSDSKATQSGASARRSTSSKRKQSRRSSKVRRVSSVTPSQKKK